MGTSVWTIAKHVALCCAFTASSRRAPAIATGDAQTRRLRSLAAEAELDERAALARWYGLAEGEPLPATSRSARPRPTAHGKELGAFD